VNFIVQRSHRFFHLHSHFNRSYSIGFLSLLDGCVLPPLLLLSLLVPLPHTPSSFAAVCHSTCNRPSISKAILHHGMRNKSTNHCLITRQISTSTHLHASHTPSAPSTSASSTLQRSNAFIAGDIPAQTAIQQYGNKILARREKRSHQKQMALLQKAMLDLPKHKWSYAFHEGPKYLHLAQKQQRNFFLLPCLDMETLTENAAIQISLLHHREISNPEDWAPFDNSQLAHGWARGFFELQFHGGGVVMHGDSYDRITARDKHAAHQGDMIGFPRGQLFLEAQAHLMGFSRSVVELILETLPVDEPKSSAKWTQLTCSGMTSNG
jgi:hypothetical protein